MIADSSGRTIGYLPLDLHASETSSTLVLEVTAESASDLLKSETSASLAIQARRTGSGDPFVDLAAGISLAALTLDVATDYDFRFVAGAVSGAVRSAIAMATVNSGAAGWGL